MFSLDNVKRLQDISQRIGYIMRLCEESGGISLALQDCISSQPAIMMHIVVCRENVEKILYSGENLTQILDKDEIRGLSAIRNFASHDYEGINFAIIEQVIREFLPVIKAKIDNQLKDIKE